MNFWDLLFAKKYGGSGGSGGGASNLVHGEFHTLNTGGNQTIDIPYTGDGFPIIVYIVVKGGANVYGSAWYDAIAKLAVGAWSMSKSDMSIAPSDSTSTTAVVTAIYKKSATASSPYSTTGAMGVDIYENVPSAPNGSALDCVKFDFHGQKMSVRTQGSSYGFMQDMDYEYFIVYSS